MGSSVKIVRAGVEHSSLIAKMFASLHNSHEMQVASYFRKIDDLNKISADIEEKIENKRRIFLIGYCDGEACGFLEGSLKRTEDSILFIPKTVAVIENVYVLPGYRRRGCATALFEGFFDYANARAVDFFELDVLINNQGALDFYKSLNFFPHIITMLRKP